MRKFGLFLMALSLIVGIVAFRPSDASAGKPEMVTLCHAAGQEGTLQFTTMTISWNAAFGQAGHFNEDGTPAAGHENDYLGACVVDPTATLNPTSSPTFTATAMSTFTATSTIEATYTPVDTATATNVVIDTATPTEIIVLTDTPVSTPTVADTVTPDPTETPVDPTETPAPTETVTIPSGTPVIVITEQGPTPTLVLTVAVTATTTERNPKWTCNQVRAMVAAHPISGAGYDATYWARHDTALRFYNNHGGCQKPYVATGAGESNLGLLLFAALLFGSGMFFVTRKPVLA